MKQRYPKWKQSKNLAKSLSPTFWPPPPSLQGYMISVKCEKPLHELTLVTVHVSLLYDHQNFKYYTFCVSESTNHVQTDSV